MDQNTMKCLLCEQDVVMGPRLWEGRFVATYSALVCHGCWNRNADGWAPEHEPVLLKRLTLVRRPVPPRNAKGLLPRE